MSGMFPVCMLLVKGCQTLVMGETILLQQWLVNMMPYTIMVHWYLLWLLRELILLQTKILPNFFDHISLMSGMFQVCMLLVKGCQTLVMGVTSLLQQSLVNTMPIPSRYTDTYPGCCANWSFRPKSCLTFLTTHHWCLACSKCVCCLWRVVRPWSWV